jgi:hypothetical protein
MSTPQQGEGGGGGGFFTRKIGVLPVWGWTAIVAGLFLLYSLYKSKSASNTGSQAQSASTVNQPGGVDSSLVPQFINQTYVNDQPPAAPNITVNNTVPPPPTVGPTPPVTPPKVPTPKVPATISSSPGSYTTGLPGGMNEWTSTGKYSLNVIAKSHGMTAQQLIAASEAAQNNVPLKNYVTKGNYNAPVPAGVELFIPNANWPTKKL